MLDHQGQITIPSTVATGQVFIDAVISQSLACDAPFVMDNDNLVTPLEAQSRMLIGMVRKSSIELIVFAKRWGITPDKVQKSTQATTLRGIGTMLHPLMSRLFRADDQNLCVILAWLILYTPTQCLPVQCPEGATDVDKFMPQTLDGLVLSQWHLKVKHMRPFHCCLSGISSHHHAFVTMPKNWQKASSIRSLKRLHVT